MKFDDVTTNEPEAKVQVALAATAEPPVGLKETLPRPVTLNVAVLVAFVYWTVNGLIAPPAPPVNAK